MDGQVRCMDCACLHLPDNMGARRCRHFWRPACVPDIWRRCEKFEKKESVIKMMGK